MAVTGTVADGLSIADLEELGDTLECDAAPCEVYSAMLMRKQAERDLLRHGRAEAPALERDVRGQPVAGDVQAARALEMRAPGKRAAREERPEPTLRLRVAMGLPLRKGEKPPEKKSDANTKKAR